MDLYDIFAGAESFHVRKLLEHARGLTDAQLDKPLNNPVHAFPWDSPAQSLRDLLRRLVVTKEVWVAALTGASLPDLDAEPPEQRTPDALCEPPETFSFAGMLAHVINLNTYQRLPALETLRRLGVKVGGFGCPTEYEASLAPAR